jgi:Xaa-Pro aminopeptidase
MTLTRAFKQADLEQVGAGFGRDKMLAVRDITRAAINEIASRCKPGMVEEDAVEMAKEILADHSMVQGWHNVYVRFGTNTTKTFGAPSDPGIVLHADDLFLIDIGPVFENCEGDGGDTFVTGSNPDYARCADDARKLFHLVRKKWDREGLTGNVLYDFAAQEAAAMGWELNLDLSGHRISDFPHAAVYDGPLSTLDFVPSPLLWVLEIHIRHPSMKYGAFFEDMLLDDSHFV